MSRYDFPRGGERWDRERLGIERERFEERDVRRGPYRAREISVDDVYARRGPRGGFEEDRYRFEEVDRERAPVRAGRDRGFTIEKEREREYYTPDAPRRPGVLRRQSSLDIFDRKPLRFAEREEYGPPARYYGPRGDDDDFRPAPPPLTPVRRQLMAPGRRYDDYDDIESLVEEDHRGYPERIREREIIRRRRRSKESSKHSRRSRSKESRSTHSTHSTSSSSSSTGSSTTISARNEFPKKGKTRMPARLVSKRAIIDLGYPYEEEGDVIIIQKALGRENIDEVIKLSEDYFKTEKVEMSGGRSEGGGTTVISERKTEVFQPPAPLPPPPGVGFAPPPPPGFRPPPPPGTLIERSEVKETKIVERSRSPSPSSASSYSRHSHHTSHHSRGGPVILEAKPRDESSWMERETIVERSAPMPVGPLALAVPPERRRVASAGGGGERDIRERIRYLELEKEALKAERKADRELRRAERIRKTRESSSTGGGGGGGELVVYDRESERYSESGYGERDVTVVKRETRLVEPEGGVRIEKDRKGRMSISVPKYT